MKKTKLKRNSKYISGAMYGRLSACIHKSKRPLYMRIPKIYSSPWFKQEGWRSKVLNQIRLQM